uniref:Longin domain-containing protein n=1 Tax=Rhizochromulina marina TaxID=1034831 RepID=A0A7S2SPF8_9STRA|mmetsp:Transcript_3570/g.10401  ORF Transcript_3570/g.10401 Transcript_3570/m.10401 type:complete len:207 (+) Transcript_3570:177-797(+)
MATRTPRVLYALVARQVNVLAEFMADEVHFQVSQIVRMVLRQISVHDQEKSLEYAEDYFFHCIIREGISFVCLTDKDFSFRKARAFLEDVRSEFMGAYGDQAHTAHTFAFNAEFAPVLQGRITFFNTDKSAEQSMDKLGITQQKINATIDQMQTVGSSLVFPLLIVLSLIPSSGDLRCISGVVSEHRKCPGARREARPPRGEDRAA